MDVELEVSLLGSAEQPVQVEHSRVCSSHCMLLMPPRPGLVLCVTNWLVCLVHPPPRLCLAVTALTAHACLCL